MLKKRTRSFQKDQYKEHLMSDYSSNSSFGHEILGQKHKSSSFFSLPGLLLGFNNKGAPELDSVRSPTSPLDYKFLTYLGNAFRVPRSNRDVSSPKSWKCSKLGLGIVNSLKDETTPPGRILTLSKGKSKQIGSQSRIDIPSSPNYLNSRMISLGDHSMSTKSLPKDYAIAPQPQMMDSKNLSRMGEITLEPYKFGTNGSFLAENSKPMSLQTSLVNHDPNLTSENFSSDEKTSSSLPPIGGGEDFSFVGMNPSSFTTSISSINGSMEPISASEDYTCVVYHGPNPKTTHIFGDRVLVCHTNELGSYSKKDEEKIESSWFIECSVDSFPNLSDDFLSSCYLCKRKMEEEEDAYMYRDRAFCSTNCRALEVLADEEMEKDESTLTSMDSIEPSTAKMTT